MCHLLGADARRLLADDQVKGKVCETFAVNEVLKQARGRTSRRAPTTISVVTRTSTSSWKTGRGDIACVEVKAAATLTSRDWRCLAKLRDARGSSFRAGVIIASVAQTTPLGDRLWAVPYSALWT